MASLSTAFGRNEKTVQSKSRQTTSTSNTFHAHVFMKKRYAQGPAANMRKKSSNAKKAVKDRFATAMKS